VLYDIVARHILPPPRTPWDLVKNDLQTIGVQNNKRESHSRQRNSTRNKNTLNINKAIRMGNKGSYFFHSL